MRSSARLQHFLQHIWSYNSSFAFVLMSQTGDESRFSTLGPYCFRISGQVYHLISQLLPADGDAPKFLQIYLYDASDEIDAWVQIFSDLQKDIFTSLQKILNDVNPYAKLYHGAGDYLWHNPTTNVKLILRSSGSGINSRRYNVPTCGDVAMIIPADNDECPLNKNIIIYKKREDHPQNKSLLSIDYKHLMYDSLLFMF